MKSIQLKGFFLILLIISTESKISQINFSSSDDSLDETDSPPDVNGQKRQKVKEARGFKLGLDKLKGLFLSDLALKLKKEDFQIKVSLEYKLSEDEQQLLNQQSIEISLLAYFNEKGKFQIEAHPNYSDILDSKVDDIQIDDIPQNVKALKKIIKNLKNLVTYVLVIFALKVGIYKKFPHFIPFFILLEVGQHRKVKFYKVKSKINPEQELSKFVILQKVPSVPNTYAQFEFIFNPQVIKNVVFDKIESKILSYQIFTKQQVDAVWDKIKDLYAKVEQAPDLTSKTEIIITNLTREIYRIHQLFTIDQIKSAGKYFLKFSVSLCFNIGKCIQKKKDFEKWLSDQTINIGSSLLRNIKSGLSFYFPNRDPDFLNQQKKEDAQLEKTVLSQQTDRFKKRSHYKNKKKISIN